jgi:hypothetical protein
MRRLTVIMTAAAAVVACSGDPTGTPPASQVTFIRVGPTAPLLANAADSFWAKKGVDRRVRIYFRPVSNSTDSSQLIEFTVPAQALFKRPDGSTIATGDSVQIHVTVVDPLHFIVSFGPAGLQFSPTEPAQLKIGFAEADSDLNNDGLVNAVDDTLRTMLSIWKQEATGLPWIRIASTDDSQAEVVEADIFGFTNYALAY